MATFLLLLGWLDLIPLYAGPNDTVGKNQLPPQAAARQLSESRSHESSAVKSPAFRIACIGDSITAGVGTSNPDTDSYPAQLRKRLGDQFEVKNFGHSGATALRVGTKPFCDTRELLAAIEFRPEVVIIMLGTNDADPPTWLEHKHRFKADYKLLIDRFVGMDSRPQVYLCLPPPIRPGKYNDRMRYLRDEVSPIIGEIAKERELKLIDIYSALEHRLELIPDEVHPNSTGAAVIAETVFKVLSR